MSAEKNIDVIERIVAYCEEVEKTITYFGNDYDVFQKNFIYRNAVATPILQIGELSGKLSADFKEHYNRVPWRNIKDMRNIVAHGYGSISIQILWETALSDVPFLCGYCQQIVKDYECLNQAGISVQDNE